jgi:type IV secretion system protein VirB10
MRTILAFAVAAVGAFAAEIPAGSHVLLRVQSTVSTRSAQVGDYIYLQTSTPIAADGRIVVPMGSHVQGVVTDVNRGGRVKGKADLSIRLDVLTLPGGQQYKISPHAASLENDPTGQRVVDQEHSKLQQDSHKEADLGRIAIFAGSGAALGAIVGNWGHSGGSALEGAAIGAGAGAAVGLATVLITRGKDVELRQGAGLDVVFDQAVTLQ